MSSLDILPYAAPIMFAATVALTSWLGYLRIMRKYPAATAAPSPDYKSAAAHRLKKPVEI